MPFIRLLYSSIAKTIHSDIDASLTFYKLIQPLEYRVPRNADISSITTTRNDGARERKEAEEETNEDEYKMRH